MRLRNDATFRAATRDEWERDSVGEVASGWRGIVTTFSPAHVMNGPIESDGCRPTGTVMTSSDWKMQGGDKPSIFQSTEPLARAALDNRHG